MSFRDGRHSVFEAGDLRVVLLDDQDASELGSLFEECADYFDLVFGLPPGPAEVQSAFVALPEGSTYDDKFLLGVLDSAHELVGHIDVVRDYPVRGVWTIGLLLLAPAARGRGIGTALVGGLPGWVGDEGGRELRVGVVEWNKRAVAFLERAGFSVTERRPNFQSGLKQGTLVVLRRPVGGG